MFDYEIQNRLDNSEWNHQVVSWVYARLNRSRTDRIFTIASFSFPLLAAALLFVILAFGLTSQEIDTSEQTIANISDVDTVLDDSGSLSYDLVDYYVETSFSR